MIRRLFVCSGLQFTVAGDRAIALAEGIVDQYKNENGAEAPTAQLLCAISCNKCF